VFIRPGTEPRTLRPFCDTLLPPQPTPLFTSLLEKAYNRSQPDVRPSNPRGRKAPMATYSGMCARHQFESKTLPEAKKRGWPECIDWEGFPGRVLKMKQDLSHILTDPGDPIVYRNDDEKEKTQNDETEQHRSKGPRMRCIFWQNLLEDLKNNGTKGVKGVLGQYYGFENTQPGYYGELGSAIIHQVLYDMFPLNTINPALVDPLTANEFMERIFVPEVGMRLVIQDMGLNIDDWADKTRAVAVLKESASYGVTMFPESQGQWG
ncbi:RTC4-like domain-containing protein, partial [Mycena epipterygia]